MGRFQLELIYLYFPPFDGKTVENKGKLILIDQGWRQEVWASIPGMRIDLVECGLVPVDKCS